MEQVELNERRRVRYVLLLTPTELSRARDLAAREFRTLPDFFRVRIHNPILLAQDEVCAPHPAERASFDRAQSFDSAQDARDQAVEVVT